MADLEDKNRNPGSGATAVAEPPVASKNPAAKKYDDPHLQELHDNRFEKKGARRAFHGVNFLGLHQIFNNVTSVVITYVMITTKYADKMKDAMANTAVGKGFSTVFAVPGKVVNAGFKLLGHNPDKKLSLMNEVEREAELALRTSEANRNAIETAFMCVAGFIALLPVYLLERHRAGFLNTVDNWLHPGRSKEEKEAAALSKEDEPKETLWNLFRARIIALAVVFGVDQTRANIDSMIKSNAKGKVYTAGSQTAAQKGTGWMAKMRSWKDELLLKDVSIHKNIDTVAGWGLGDFIYKRLPDRLRSWLANFFSGSLDALPSKPRHWLANKFSSIFKGNNVILSGIQPETREEVLTVTGASPEVRDASSNINGIIVEKRDALKKAISANKGALENKVQEAIEAPFNARIKAIEAEVVEKGFYKEVERAVFAEQARLFITKEVFLTTILSAVIYFCAKSPTALKFMEKIGLAKKGTYEKEHAELEARRNGNHHDEPKGHEDAPEAHAKADSKQKGWAAREEKHDVKTEKAPAASFAEAATNSQNQEATVSLR